MIWVKHMCILFSLGASLMKAGRKERAERKYATKYLEIYWVEFSFFHFLRIYTNKWCSQKVVAPLDFNLKYNFVIF